MVFPNDRLRLAPAWITPAAGKSNREVQPVIIVRRRRLLLYPSYVQDYLDRVTAADVAAGNTSGLEVGVTDGANTFIQDLVSDTYLGVSSGVISQAASVIKASVPMAGARTRLGAMTPLVGPAPTSFNFGNNDYNRRTGLVGNGLDKYLDSNRTTNASPQNNRHFSTYASTLNSQDQSRMYFGSLNSNDSSTGGDQLFSSDTFPGKLASRCGTLTTPDGTKVSTSNLHAVGFIGISRNISSAYTIRGNSINETITAVSGVPNNQRAFIFARNLNAALDSSLMSNTARLAFYSIGESLDLAILDARVTALINAYAAAIP